MNSFVSLLIVIAFIWSSICCHANQIEDADSITFVTEKIGLIGEVNKIWKTEDGGKSWKLVYTLSSKAEEDFIQHIKMVNLTVGYATGFLKFLKTEDGGKTWKQIVLLPRSEKTEVFCSAEPSFDSRNNIFIAASNSLFFSTDAGVSWKKIPWPFSYNDELMVTTIINFRILAGSFKGNIYESTDNGSKWKKVGENRSPEKDAGRGETWLERGKGAWAIHTLKVFPSGVGYAVNLGGGVSKTEDGGKIWKMVRHPVPAPTEKEHLNAIKKGIDLYIEMFHWSALVFDEKRIFIPSDGGDLIYTHDGGKNWNRAKVFLLDGKKSSEDLRSVSMIDTNKGWMVGLTGRLYKTEDGGKTWKQQSYKVIDKSSKLR